MKAVREEKIQEGAFVIKLHKEDNSIPQLLRDIERKYRVMENLRSTQDSCTTVFGCPQVLQGAHLKARQDILFVICIPI